MDARPSLFSIYIAVFVSIAAFSMVFPLLPLYAKTFQASDAVIGSIAASFALAQMFFSPLWGALTDRFGRKPVIAAGLLGMSCAFLLFAVSTSIFMLFASRFLQGAFAAAVLPSARAYVADVTKKEERVKALGRLGAMLMLGAVFGPAIGGLLAGNDMSLPFFVGSAIAFLNFFFIAFFLPESLPRAVRKKTPFRGISGFRFKESWLALHSSLAPLFLLAFAWSFLIANKQVALPLLGAEHFSLDVAAIGFLFAVMGILSAFVQFFLIEKITRAIGSHLTIAVGLLASAVSFALLPFAPVTAALFLVASLAGLGAAVARPVITALISQETSEGQGITMGTASMFESAGRLVGPFVGGVLFSFWYAGPFVFSGIFVTLLIGMLLWKSHYLKAEHQI